MGQDRLTAGQRSALRKLADQIRHEDPGLAEQLAGSPPQQRVPFYLTPAAERLCGGFGLLLFLTGMYLAVVSAALFGMGLVALAVLRYRQRQKQGDVTPGVAGHARAGD